ncbi:MAG: TPM domain-containing protein [Burkholderiales bacterium]|nr:TPM domain-containing protein [Burkholderiales bacterium]
MNRWWRLLVHRFSDDRDVRRAIGDAGLARLEARVRASERSHAGEICISIEGGLPLSYVWRRLTARDRAIMLFGKLRVWDTEANNGVLIYLLLAERAIEVVADRGVARHVAVGHWDEVVTHMREAFAAGRFEDGLMQAVAEVEALLVAHYPLAEGQANPNELADAVDVR